MGLIARTLTPPGRGGVAVVELRGPSAPAFVRGLSAGRLPEVGEARLLRLYREGELLDESLCVRLGEEHLELHLHGSPAVVESVLELVPAQRSEERPSLEERALVLASRARSESAARMLLDQSEGALRRELEALEALAPGARAQVAACLLQRARAARFLIDPPLVCLAGPANAGKSTLLNVLLGHERVVVSAEAGTTRDPVRAWAQIGAWAVELVDTAGERGGRRAPEGPAGELEQLGVERGRELRERADVLLWLSPAPACPPVPEGVGRANLRTVVSRADLLGRKPGGKALSAWTDPEGARALVLEQVLEVLALPERPWQPGAAVPFEPVQVALLEQIAAAPDQGSLGRLRNELLSH